MKRERVNQALKIEMQIASTRRRLAVAMTTAANLENRLRLLEEQQFRLNEESQLPLGRSTRKNQKKYTVWYSVREALRDTLSDGLTTAELHQAVCEEHRNLNIITFRAYLREFHCVRHLLDKKHDRWHLAKHA
ncbi:hypothetical protein [Hyphomicrobium sp. 99]|uniref:hypothetical protein n=1 Tax=Hyphomicrobium sp. 99 TaxID=1163419 RepID=UPI0005F7B868|nr:hypothetical protein [Hyphomicrobium sp. 99]